MINLKIAIKIYLWQQQKKNESDFFYIQETFYTSII